MANVADKLQAAAGAIVTVWLPVTAVMMPGAEVFDWRQSWCGGGWSWVKLNYIAGKAKCRV